MENQDNIIIKRGRGRPPVYSTEERKEAIKNSKTNYMLNKGYCDICNTGRNYTLAGKHCHLKTKKHRVNVAK